MLVLTRYVGQRFYVGDDVCITLVEVDRGRVRLTVEAPKEVPVFRAEILEPGQLPSEAHRQRQEGR